MKTLPFALRSVLFAVPALVSGCDGLQQETLSSEYVLYSDALASAAIQQGWLPESLPADASAIVEAHNPDTNQIWARFELTGRGADEFLESCSRLPRVALPKKEPIRKLVKWWPGALTIEGYAGHENFFRLYSCPSMQHAHRKADAEVAIDSKGNTVWYWIVRYH